jgi:alpha-D-xyloside xylohydrolase
VRHYGEQPGVFELYEDDGLSFDYENGAFGFRTLSFDDGGGREAVTRPGPAMFGPVERWVAMTRKEGNAE